MRLTGLAGLADFVGQAEPELAANAMLCAVNQAAYLLKRQLESQSREFLEKGGFTENLHAARVKARRSDKSDGADPSDKSTPACPACGQPMRERTARKGPRAGQSFLGLLRLPGLQGNRRDVRPVRPTHEAVKTDTTARGLEILIDAKQQRGVNW